MCQLTMVGGKVGLAAEVLLLFVVVVVVMTVANHFGKECRIKLLPKLKIAQ